MSEELIFVALEADAGERADAVVTLKAARLSRTLVKRLFLEHRVRINGRPARAGQRIHEGDRIEADIVLPPSLSAEPEDIPLRVVYEDEDLAVIDKPAGLVVHPAPGHAGGTLANALRWRFPDAVGAGDAFRPGIVHRLDKDTSGLMVVALTPQAHVALQRALAQHRIEREYLALATGRLEPASGVIDAPIGRDPTSRRRMAVYGVAARHARTRYDVLEYLSGYTYIRARLETGRTHQIRVHLAAMGHAVAGDRLYHGGLVDGLTHQFLHAHRLVLQSPSSGEDLEFTSALPEDLARILRALHRDGAQA